MRVKRTGKLAEQVSKRLTFLLPKDTLSFDPSIKRDKIDNAYLKKPKFKNRIFAFI